ncbi:hypothetical protein C8A00DRAFT_39467 [Chaetomidium leptoderma]|uniref:Postreplication repair E3 ubiquitin-protein ligase RAD18 n=1 Tax=Chaetomidium leptoderma TaxID=669021 RepID=A0AAN7A1T9_9PEZI|nr:hypothetical protein C8A00DRAFT_39467 [Chaetomidium leptoderma]
MEPFSGDAFDVPDSTDWLGTPLAGVMQVEQAFRCHVCKDFYNSPMITSCNHTFCSICIRRCLSVDGKCPLCRALDQESKLRGNWALREAVDAFVKSRDAMLQFARAPVAVSTPRSPKRKATELGEPMQEAQENKRPRMTTRSSKARATEATAAIMQEEVDVPDSEDTADYEPEPGIFAAEDGLAACPICWARMKPWQVDRHIDNSCPGSPQPQKTSSSTANNRGGNSFSSARNPFQNPPTPTKAPERLPAVAYSMLKDIALRKKMSELGLSTAGPRQMLEKRHQEWITIWNANCDSARPKKRSELLQDLEIWERTIGNRAPTMAMQKADGASQAGEASVKEPGPAQDDGKVADDRVLESGLSKVAVVDLTGPPSSQPEPPDSPSKAERGPPTGSRVAKEGSPSRSPPLRSFFLGQGHPTHHILSRLQGLFALLPSFLPLLFHTNTNTNRHLPSSLQPSAHLLGFPPLVHLPPRPLRLLPLARLLALQRGQLIINLPLIHHHRARRLGQDTAHLIHGRHLLAQPVHDRLHPLRPADLRVQRLERGARRLHHPHELHVVGGLLDLGGDLLELVDGGEAALEGGLGELLGAEGREGRDAVGLGDRLLGLVGQELDALAEEGGLVGEGGEEFFELRDGDVFGGDFGGFLFCLGGGGGGGGARGLDLDGRAVVEDGGFVAREEAQEDFHVCFGELFAVDELVVEGSVEVRLGEGAVPLAKCLARLFHVGHHYKLPLRQAVLLQHVCYAQLLHCPRGEVPHRPWPVIDALLCVQELA